MARKSIIIIGAGMGGLAAGIYGQMNGFKTRIFEMHSKPGGQCAAWKRQEYLFDACIHHLFGCDPSSRIYDLWHELGAMPRDLVPIRECVSVVSPEGKLFHDYYDLEMLEQHLRSLSPRDEKAIVDYINGIRKMANKDFFGEAMMGSGRGLLKMLPAILSSFKWSKTTMQQYGDRFFDPFLKRAFPLLEYSLPEIPFLLHLAKHANGYTRAIQWPVGGSREFSRSIEKRYHELGGETQYKQKVEKILVEHNAARGVRLADGSEHFADIVISDADGRKTIMDLLEGRYIDERIRGYCTPPRDETSWAVHVFLGVNRDLAREPSALIMLLDKPLTIAGHVYHSLEMQIYGFDRTMAPEGKGIIKVELVSRYSYWKQLHADRQRYDEEKQKVAEQVIDALEARFKGIKSQVEVIDVPTLMTWERYMGGTHGFAGMPNRKAGIIKSLIGKGQETTLPGLSGFHMVGQWVTAAGALFSNALSGRNVVKTICKQEGRKFITCLYQP
jgi:phytoene dehydrogenase-like protein